MRFFYSVCVGSLLLTSSFACKNLSDLETSESTNEPTSSPTPSLPPDETGLGTSLTVTSIEHVDPSTIRVSFSKPLHADQALSSDNVTLMPAIDVISVELTAPTRLTIKTRYAILPFRTEVLLKDIKTESNEAISALQTEFTPKTKVAFITSSIGGGNFNVWPKANDKTGLAAAHEVCKQEAADAGLVGEFAAWISDSQNDARTPFMGDTGSWFNMRPTHDIVALSLPDLLSGRILSPISANAAGGLLPQGAPISFAHHASNLDGTKKFASSTDTCSDWTVGSGGPVVRDYGMPNSSGGTWVKTSFLGDCATNARLYCLQKGDGLYATAPTPTARKVFVTSVTGTGNLLSWADAAGATTGQMAADQICRKRAEFGGLANFANFKAWISSLAAGGALSHFTNTMGPYVSTRGTLIANTLVDLANDNLKSGISYDENKDPRLGQTYAFTGTNTGGGNSGQTCNEWTDSTTASTVNAGIVGLSMKFWQDFYTGSNVCNRSYALYCVED